MKRSLAFASAVLFAGLSASLVLADAPSPRGSQPRSTLLNDLVRMTSAGDSDAALLAYARARRTELPPELNVATLQWLRDSGVRPAVVSYMSAIDVRAQSTDIGAHASEGVTYADQAGRPRAADGGGDADYDAGDVSSSEGSAIYTGLGSNAGGAPYSDSYDYGYGGYGGYGYDPYASFGYGYPYWGSPFPTWFVVDISHDHSHGHHGGWHDHDHHGGGGHDGSGWNHAGGGRHDGWRDRGSHGPRDGGMTAGSRTFSRPEIARSARSGGGARGGPAWGGRRNPGTVGPRGQLAASRGFTRPAPGRSGGSIGRAPITAPASPRAGGGGVRTAGPAAGSAGGRGRR